MFSEEYKESLLLKKFCGSLFCKNYIDTNSRIIIMMTLQRYEKAMETEKDINLYQDENKHTDII